MNSIKDLHERVKKGETTFVETLKTYFAKIENEDKEINSFISLNKEAALAAAKKSDEKVKKEEQLAPLEGVPFSIKDMFCTKGLKTTAASNMLKDFVPPYDATVIQRLKEAGALIVGKTNQDEFAMGSSNENSFFGPVKNPWNKERVAGGSSGGSAAAVAARFSLCSFGTDTGGSVRQPAHFCGTVGFKPTYGRMSRYGVVAFASSLDQPGFFSLKVEDVFKTAQALAGKDPRDNTSSSALVPNWSEEIEKFSGNLKGKKIGLIKEHIESKLDEDVREALDKSIEALKKRGAEFVELTLPMVKHGVPAYYLIATSEAASNLSRYDGVRYGHRSKKVESGNLSLEEFYSLNRSEGFGKEVKRRILLGNFSLSSGYYDAYYKKACQVRRLIRENYIDAFKKVDCILSPVAVSSAFKFEENLNDPIKKFLNDYFTVTVNLAGLPGLTVPIFKGSKGMPCGVQLISKEFEESELLQVGMALEEDFQFYKEVPGV